MGLNINTLNSKIQPLKGCKYFGSIYHRLTPVAIQCYTPAGVFRYEQNSTIE